MFEKFYRGVKHRHDHRGTGLGLAICRAITAAHGGTITATNRDGGGSRFRIVLPLGELIGPAPPTTRLAEAFSMNNTTTEVTL